MSVPLDLDLDDEGWREAREAYVSLQAGRALRDHLRDDPAREAAPRDESRAAQLHRALFGASSDAGGLQVVPFALAPLLRERRRRPVLARAEGLRAASDGAALEREAGPYRLSLVEDGGALFLIVRWPDGTDAPMTLSVESESAGTALTLDLEPPVGTVSQTILPADDGASRQLAAALRSADSTIAFG